MEEGQTKRKKERLSQNKDVVEAARKGNGFGKRSMGPQT